MTITVRHASASGPCLVDLDALPSVGDCIEERSLHPEHTASVFRRVAPVLASMTSAGVVVRMARPGVWGLDTGKTQP